MSESAPPDDFLSGHSGLVVGPRATSRALLKDAGQDAWRIGTAEPARLRRAARATPPRRVLVVAVERTDERNLLASARSELLRSRHYVDFETTAVGERGKFENLNALLARRSPAGYDWLLAIDDDVWLPRGFLNGFVFLAERFDLALAQPAHRARSHAAWAITRRRLGSVVRETPWVEIGPVVAFHRRTFEALLPFPELRMGWGLDSHWAAVARQAGWRLGIVDALAIRHGLRATASAYGRDEAIAEGRRFLADRPHLGRSESQRTLATHRSWR
ncbi:MAG: glycosyltransferase family 2 protein [Solirubrobacteraceae bacterium]